IQIAVALHALLGQLDQTLGGGGADVGRQQRFLELEQRLRIDGPAAEQGTDLLAEPFARPGEAGAHLAPEMGRGIAHGPILTAHLFRCERRAAPRTRSAHRTSAFGSLLRTGYLSHPAALMTSRDPDQAILEELVALASRPERQLLQFRSLVGAHQYLGLYRLVRRYVPAGGSVLDWGTGNGHFSYFLVRAGYRATGF